MSEEGEEADTSGWNFFNGDNLKAALDEANKRPDEHLELAKAFKRAFSSPDGVIVLEHLQRRTLKTPVMVPGIPDPVISASIREGENNLFRYILAMIRMAVQKTKQE